MGIKKNSGVYLSFAPPSSRGIRVGTYLSIHKFTHIRDAANRRQKACFVWLFGGGVRVSVYNFYI